MLMVVESKDDSSFDVTIILLCIIQGYYVVLAYILRLVKSVAFNVAKRCIYI
jgi:hypothetical protein